MLAEHNKSPTPIHESAAVRESSDDNYSQDDLETLLAPERQPRSTKLGPQPIFSYKALAVMAIFQSSSRRLTAKEISEWICRTFLLDSDQRHLHKSNIISLLMVDTKFVPTSEFLGHDRRMQLHPELERSLQNMKGQDGSPFDPVHHIKRHFEKLQSGAIVDSEIPLSQSLSGGLSYPAFNVPAHALDSGDRMAHGTLDLNDTTSSAERTKATSGPRSYVPPVTAKPPHANHFDQVTWSRDKQKRPRPQPPLTQQGDAIPQKQPQPQYRPTHLSAQSRPQPQPHAYSHEHLPEKQLLYPAHDEYRRDPYAQPAGQKYDRRPSSSSQYPPSLKGGQYSSVYRGRKFNDKQYYDGDSERRDRSRSRSTSRSRGRDRDIRPVPLPLPLLSSLHTTPDIGHHASDSGKDNKSSQNGANASKIDAESRAEFSRKRITIACLTCRKRRIKCDGERPVCKSCNKSKRHCEGYSQGVSFKPPNFDYAAPKGGAAHAGLLPISQSQPDESPYMLDPAREASSQSAMSSNETRPQIGERSSKWQSPWDSPGRGLSTRIEEPNESMRGFEQIAGTGLSSLSPELENSKDPQRRPTDEYIKSPTQEIRDMIEIPFGERSSKRQSPWDPPGRGLSTRIEKPHESMRGFEQTAGTGLSALSPELENSKDPQRSPTDGYFTSPAQELEEIGDMTEIWSRAESWLSHDAKIPFSQSGETDPWPVHIESKGGISNFARQYPEIAEHKNQHHRGLNVLSDSISWNERIGESFSQPLELEKKIDSQHNAAETKHVNSTESGNGHKLIDDVHATSRPDTTLLDEQSRAPARLISVASILILIIPISFAASFLGMIWENYVQGSSPWFPACYILCTSAFLYTAWDLTSEGFLRRAQEPSPVLGPYMIVQRALAAQITKLTGLKFQSLEAPVPMGMKRPASTDDAAGESAPSAAGICPAIEQLEQAISRDNGPDRNTTRGPDQDHIQTGMTVRSQQRGNAPNQQSNPTGIGYPFGKIGTSLKNRLMGSSQAGSLPTHNPGNVVANNTAVSTPRIPDHLEYLLLCIPFKSHANKLMNIDTTTPRSSDTAFFRLLRQTYVKNRGRFRNLFSVRALSEIRFVQFEVFRNDLADVRKFDCIPPEAQKNNYLYSPMPAEFEPPIGKNQMRHLYDHPDHADDLPVCYSRVPRKLRERLSAAPGLGRSEGWGICFIEGVSWPRVCALGLAGVLASTVFGVVWTVVQQDIQGGFGVASCMLGVLVLGLGALQGAFEM